MAIITDTLTERIKYVIEKHDMHYINVENFGKFSSLAEVSNKLNEEGLCGTDGLDEIKQSLKEIYN